MKKVKKLTKKELELQQSWEALLKRHSKPLEKGWGLGDKKRKRKPLNFNKLVGISRAVPAIPSLNPQNMCVHGNSAYEDPTLLEARKELQSRSVPLYNKRVVMGTVRMICLQR